MKFKQFNGKYFLQLEQHEELTRELKKFCDENNIKNAVVNGIGAINSVTLGFYNTQTQNYTEQSIHTSFELSSLYGHIITDDITNEFSMHLHATVCDKDFRTYGGHLFRAIVSKTIECVLTVL